MRLVWLEHCTDSLRRGAIAIAILAGAALLIGGVRPVAAADQALNARRLRAAESAVQKRIQAHPQCPRAHLAYAAVLAEENRTTEGRREFGEAERLAPGLPFAPPSAVHELERKLGLGAQFSEPRQTQWHF